MSDMDSNHDFLSYLKYAIFIELAENENLDRNIRYLAELVFPGQIEYKTLSKQLKNPTDNFDSTFKILEHYALQTKDRHLQIPAIIGLEKLRGPKAIIALTKRSMDTYLVTPLKRSQRALFKLQKDGGLITLVATLCFDYRYITAKIAFVLKYLKIQNDPDLINNLEEITSNYKYFIEYKSLINDVFLLLEESKYDDLKHGAIIGRYLFNRDTKVLGGTLIGLDAMVMESVDYVENRVPGLFFDVIEPIQRKRRGFSAA